MHIDRRTLLSAFGAYAATNAVPAWAARDPGSCSWPPPGWAEKGFPTKRWVKIVFVPTGERFENLYMDGKYVIPAVQQFSWVCRDHRRNEWAWLNPFLMDFLFVIHWKYCKDEIQILSGYRTPETKVDLERSVLSLQHTRANALDIRVPDVDAVALAEDFATFIYGGVSLFPSLNFIHLDCGPLNTSVESESRKVSGSGQTKLVKSSQGTYHVPVLLNRTAELNFIIDSGASDVSIPSDVMLKLVRSGTVDKADFIGMASYRLADGSTVRSPRFFIREMILGDVVVRNAEASIGNLGSPLLLGQSFLSKFQSWTLDNERHVLILKSK